MYLLVLQREGCRLYMGCSFLCVLWNTHATWTTVCPDVSSHLALAWTLSDTQLVTCMYGVYVYIEALRPIFGNWVSTYDTFTLHISLNRGYSTLLTTLGTSTTDSWQRWNIDLDWWSVVSTRGFVPLLYFDLWCVAPHFSALHISCVCRSVSVLILLFLFVFWYFCVPFIAGKVCLRHCWICFEHVRTADQRRFEENRRRVETDALRDKLSHAERKNTEVNTRVGRGGGQDDGFSSAVHLQSRTVSASVASRDWTCFVLFFTLRSGCSLCSSKQHAHGLSPR